MKPKAVTFAADAALKPSDRFLPGQVLGIMVDMCISGVYVSRGPFEHARGPDDVFLHHSLTADQRGDVRRCLYGPCP